MVALGLEACTEERLLRRPAFAFGTKNAGFSELFDPDSVPFSLREHRDLARRAR